MHIEILANNKQIAELENRIRLRVNWKPDEPGIYDVKFVLRNKAGEEFYRSAEVDIIVQSN